MELYHLSFAKLQTAVWKPRLPSGYATETVSSFREHDIPRICVSSSIEGAFYAVYPNVAKYFEEEKYPHMDFFVYSPDVRLSTKIMTPEELTRKRYVWDAHVTKEYDILTPVRMRPNGKVRFFNTTSQEWIKTRPFDDPTQPLVDIAPPAKYEILHKSTRW